MPRCDNKIETISPGGNKSVIRCGRSYMMVKQLCVDCMKKAKVSYPQGWLTYPGDTCKHGVYVGGCGADHMCGSCEDGD